MYEEAPGFRPGPRVCLSQGRKPGVSVYTPKRLSLSSSSDVLCVIVSVVSETIKRLEVVRVELTRELV